MILCLGTTPTAQRTMVFDRLRLDEVNRAVCVEEYGSGKSINVARVARLLGEEVTAMGFVGGKRGEMIVRGLVDLGVTRLFLEIEPETRLCTTVIDRAVGTVTELVEDHAPVPEPYWYEFYRRFNRRIPEADICVMSGSLPPGANPAFYRNCIAFAAKSSCQVILDARGEPLQFALSVSGFTVKLNREELGATVGRNLETDADLRAAMRDVCPKLGRIIVTMGGAGAVAYADEQFFRIPAPAIDAVNPIGSGDAFAAGLAVGLVRKMAFADALCLAAAAGAANALHPKAGFVNPEDVQRLARDVEVASWSA